MTSFWVFVRLGLLFISLGGSSIVGLSSSHHHRKTDKLRRKANNVPSTPDNNYNFHVDSVGEERRQVRIFLNSLNKKHDYYKSMGVLEGNKTLLKHRSISGTHLIRNISNKKHKFVFYKKRGRRSETRLASTNVPAQDELLTLPGFVVSVSEDGGYVYRWVLPSSDEAIVKVTMIWCDRIDEDAGTCAQDILGQTKLDVGQTKFRFKSIGNYKAMALRVDTKSSSTGIVAPACENFESEVGMLNDSPVMAANASHISIEWAMQCLEEGVVYGVAAFNVYYCPVRDDECVEPERKQMLQTKETTLNTVIGELAPGTQYRIAGTVTLANGNESARRERLFTTMEAPPQQEDDEKGDIPQVILQL